MTTRHFLTRVLLMTLAPTAALAGHGFTPGLWMLTYHISGGPFGPSTSTAPGCLRGLDRDLGYQGAMTIQGAGMQMGPAKAHIVSHGDATTVTISSTFRQRLMTGIETTIDDTRDVFSGSRKGDKVRGTETKTTILPNGRRVVEIIALHGHWISPVCPAHTAPVMLGAGPGNTLARRVNAATARANAMLAKLEAEEKGP
ncbi:hypothetical protein [Acidiferrobacter sp.]|uniref:hypothetical protein n=1 Tax=Acidiferrobacter sp. TaxID=1872107 RepID=UPI00262FEDBF|nr:hypothetical protein [Acidiferrobacter sp.]